MGKINVASDDERASWRKTFEQSEPEALRLRISKPWAAMSDEYRREAEAWLREQDAAADRREESRSQTRLLTLIAAAMTLATAAIGLIAVWPKH
jgi:hypothetical protein